LRTTSNPFQHDVCENIKAQTFPMHQICCRNNILLIVIVALKTCAVAYSMHCERWIPVQFSRKYRMRGKSENSQPWQSARIVTQPWVKPHAGADWYRSSVTKRQLTFVFRNRGGY